MESVVRGVWTRIKRLEVTDNSEEVGWKNDLMYDEVIQFVKAVVYILRKRSKRIVLV